MRALRRLLDEIEPLFAKGGPLERFAALYEATDTFLFTPRDVTHGAPHVRDAIDLKRVMTTVVLAVLPCALFGMYNVGHQANLALASLGLEVADGWRGLVLAELGVGVDPANFWHCFTHGALYFLPIYIVTLMAGGLFETIFAAVRNHEINEGFLVTSMLYALTLPATIPLWQVALGITFGVVIGKEVFGGTGKNFLNPALTGRAFLFFAYPAQISGDAVWVPVDGFTGATALARAAESGLEGITAVGLTWSDAFIGHMAGSIGETSALACLIGAAFLVYARIASWRIMLSVLLGMVATVTLFNWVGRSGGHPFLDVPWYWHAVLGGYAFGLVFMATDPVSASMTRAGQWVYGIVIGLAVAIIRVLNPAYPEGMML
ncbi:MAG TPA: NADH:ubiquinone reductase (Na(+)-transporting) subunit B, partial [Quisquiliibacterium sp.]|nr:NADH:ubiquinone reductase (Na(+)-transporting) subunit B [Quisquiliibacterium sp.]